MYFHFFKRRIKTAYVIIVFLSLISFQTVSLFSLFPNVPLRMELQNSIFQGTMEPPYQYRILNPAIAYPIQQIISIVIKDESTAHVFSYQLTSFFILLGIYFLFYLFLINFFTEKTCIIGLMLLYLVMPLGITGVWGEDEDYLTVLFYLIGLYLIFNSKEKYLPLVIATGTFNREQIIFLLAFYSCYALSQNRLFKKETIIIILLSIVSWIGVIYLLRLLFGFKQTKYTVDWNVSENIRIIKSIIVLWSVMVLPFVILCILAFKKSSNFFKYSFISIGIYIILFFFNGFLSQMTKFIPAYLILIPMSLQYLFKEHTGRDVVTNNLKIIESVQ